MPQKLNYVLYLLLAPQYMVAAQPFNPHLTIQITID